MYDDDYVVCLRKHFVQDYSVANYETLLWHMHLPLIDIAEDDSLRQY